MHDDGRKEKLEIPSDTSYDIYEDSLIIKLKTDWSYQGLIYKSGSLLRTDIDKLLAGYGTIEILFSPASNIFLKSYSINKDRIFLILTEDVNNKVVELKKVKGQFRQVALPFPANSTIHIVDSSQKLGIILFSTVGFLEPMTIYSLNLNSNELKIIDHAPARFDSSQYVVKQFFTYSKDHTRVPYYVVHHKELKYNGKNPTIIYAYGGFEHSIHPDYNPSIESAWLKNNYVWVVANIRGGGEYGPEWHNAGLKENRQRVFDDFYSVAEDLVRLKITSSRNLGAIGGSNGGLLMGVSMTQRPDLFNAIVLQVPLLDMNRFHLLLAGASWVGEYGSPDDPVMRQYLLSYSPYHNLRVGVKYPEVFFITATSDDRVHPGHARKMAAKMNSMNHPFLYYENIDGGHKGSANNEQSAKKMAYEFIYFLKKLAD